MHKLKVTQVGNGLAILLTKQAASDLGVEKGDEVTAIPTQEGLSVTAYDVEFEEQMKAAEHVMKRDRNLLRELAKR